MLRLSSLHILESIEDLVHLPEGKMLINTINAYSYNMAQKDEAFAEALAKGDYLIPDGASIVKACRWLKGKSRPKERIAGWDLFEFEMERTEERRKKEEGKRLRVMFLGSSERVLGLIRERAKIDYPNLEVVTYSPPYKAEFTNEDSNTIVKVINETNPDLLWIGMTAPKQETWIWQHWQQLDIHCHVGTIGAVFDFYAGTVKRAPLWMQRNGLEWLYRLEQEPHRLWRRYLLGNPIFIWYILKEELNKKDIYDTKNSIG